MKRLHVLALLLICFTSTRPGAAQAPFEAGIYVGATNYLGDLAEEVTIRETQAAYGMFARWNPFKFLGIKTSLLGGRLSGNDRNSPWLYKRAFRFSAPYWSGNLHLEVFPFAKRKYLSPFKFKPGVQPFLHAGIGYTFMHAEVDASDSPDNAFKVPVPEPGDHSTFFNTSFGLGLRFDLWEYWSLSLDGSWWYVYSDYLDGISLNGRPDRNDWYLTAGISVSHHFGGRTICPGF